MALRIVRRESSGVDILALEGRLVLGDISVLRQSIGEIVSKGERKVVLNLQDVTFIDSAGLGELVQAQITVRKAGESLKLTGLRQRPEGPPLRDLLQINKLSTVFEEFPSERAAVESFRSSYWCVCDKHGRYLGPPPCPDCPPK